MNLISIVGWLGAITLMLAYFLLVHKNLTSRSKVYQSLNIIGALFLGISAYSHEAYPSFATNLIWVIIGIYGFYHIFKLKKKTKK